MQNPFLNGFWLKKTFSAFHFPFVILFSISLFIYISTPNLQISQFMSGISRNVHVHFSRTKFSSVMVWRIFKRLKNSTRHFVHTEAFNEWGTSLSFPFLVCAHAQSAIKAEFVRVYKRTDETFVVTQKSRFMRYKGFNKALYKQETAKNRRKIQTVYICCSLILSSV